MRVLVVAQYFPPDLGGSATRAFNLAKGLALNGCRVTVVTGFPHYPHGNIPKEYRWVPLKVEWMGNVKVFRTLMPPVKSEGILKRLVLMGFFAVSALFALPFVGKVDAVWASSWVPGLIYGRVKRKPVALNEDDLTLEDVVDLNLMDEDSLIIRVAEWVYRLFLIKGDVVTPVSSAYVETLSKKYWVDESQIHVVIGGVDLSVFKPCASKPRSAKKFVVLYSGAFSVAYDFEQIFKAAKIVEEKCGDVEFVLQGIGELAGSMRSTIDELNVKSVRIVDRLLSREDVAELLCQADVLVLPLVEFNTPYRGMSSKLYEYQAVGKPIICCSRGLPSVFVKETNSGLAVYPGDYLALSEAVIELKRNSEMARMMGENGRKYVESEASIEAVGLKMKEIFETLTQKRSLLIGT
jgi:glycosyltransferase involved in cell wall biosynthesis